MTNDELQILIDRIEDEHTEFKEAKHQYSYDNLVEYTIALANEHGGILVLGVTNKKPRQIVGTAAFADLTRTKENLIYKVGLRIEVEEYVTEEQKRVLLFRIPSRPIGIPMHIDGRYLMRAGEALVAMTPDMLKRIFAESEPDYTAITVPNISVADLDHTAIQNFRRAWSQKSGNPEILKISDLQLLTDAELIIDERVTIAALVFFGTYKILGKVLPQSELIFEYRENNASGPAAQRLEFREGFFCYYDKIWETINLRNTVQHFQDGLFIWDIKTFNEYAIREALLNAVSHRDYRLSGSVFVRQYPDRIEIASPGGLPPGITLENILWEQSPRNRRIAENFARCGLVERSGQGMNRIYETCIRESKGYPDFAHTDSNNFWITMHGRIQNVEFLKLLEKIGLQTLTSFSVDDFIVIQTLFDSRTLPERLYTNAEQLAEQGILERKHIGRKRGWILARKIYETVGKAGIYTRKKGLDKETNKELLLKHIKESGKEGAKMSEFTEVLPFLTRRQIQKLLKELQGAEFINCVGRTANARWIVVIK